MHHINSPSNHIYIFRTLENSTQEMSTREKDKPKITDSWSPNIFLFNSDNTLLLIGHDFKDGIAAFQVMTKYFDFF